MANTLEIISGISFLVAFEYPIVLFITAFISSFKSKHVWCVSMYLYPIFIAVSLFCFCFPDGEYILNPIRINTELLILYIPMILVPLVVQLKSFNKKTRLILMWIFTTLISIIAVLVLVLILIFVMGARMQFGYIIPTLLKTSV